MKRTHIITLSLLSCLLFTACNKSEVKTDTSKGKKSEIQFIRKIETITAKDTTINRRHGIYLTSEALNFTMDTTARRELEAQNYTFIDADNCKENEAAVWLFDMKGKTFQQAHIGVIQTYEDFTLTSGIRAGEEIVTGLPMIPQNQQDEQK